MKYVPERVARRFARQVLVAQKHSPTIMFGVGIVGMVGSTALACRATLKLEEVLSETKRDLTLAKSLEHDTYSDQDRQKDITLIYVRSGVTVGKLYAPAIIIGSAAVGCLTTSHRTLTKRNAALTAAYAAVSEGFAEYRRRVVEEFGEEKDRDLRYASETVPIKNGENGRSKKEKRVSPDAASIYARFFDPCCPSWSKEPEYNLLFIKCQQSYANDLLRSRGHVFLNEVYDQLGIERSRAGAVVGWIIGYGEDSDNYIDFGLFDDNQQARNFVNGREGSILLDFNVDGVIFDKLVDDRGPVAWQAS